MNDRREFLQVAALLTLAAAQTQAADAPASRGRGEIARYPLGGELAGKEAVLVDLIVRPGSANGGAHRHPGFVLGYVVEGEYVFAVDDEEHRVVRAGETFFEAAGAKHGGDGVVQQKPAHLLAFMVVPAGIPLSTPA